jgi:uncharacterized protein
MQFEWDAEKGAANARKHRVTFEGGETVFRDPLSLAFPDPDHWHGEHRYIEIGYPARGRLLMVSSTERQGRIMAQTDYQLSYSYAQRTEAL